ncbi:alpha-1,3-mannosyl-glycoprotein 4-beta-N-acetylglucosaminyltransferase A-like [Xenentodon cancila]
MPNIGRLPQPGPVQYPWTVGGVAQRTSGSAVPDLQTLYKRLLVAEELGGQVSKDLISILEQLVNMSKHANFTFPMSNTSGTNTTVFSSGQETVQRGGDAQVSAPGRDSKLRCLHEDNGICERQPGGSWEFLQPNIYTYMPHLREHPDSLVPNVVLGKGRRGVSIVLGVPTVKREKQNYLVNTLSSLLFSLTTSECQDLLIIVFVAETDLDYVGKVAETIKKNFPKDVESGLLEVVSPSQYYYPDFSTLRETFGDSKDRVKWRTKQNLDFSFLMLYAQDKGTYYVQLEDDVIAKDGYYSDMKTFANREASRAWLYVEFSQLGFIGKMFRTHDLPLVAEFFLMFHKDKPIDWLLDHILWVKVCNPEKNEKDCTQQKALLRQRYKPSLFQHVGLHSSLPGKLQHLKDKDFMKQILYQVHTNPPAELSSSLKHYQQHSLDRLYNGDDFFWALTPVHGDYILFSFPQPIHISGYRFRSGNIKTSGDKFYNTTVEVLPSNGSAKDKLGIGSSNYKESDTGFIIIGAFENGLAEGEIDAALQPVSALRLVFQADSDVWALLSEKFTTAALLAPVAALGHTRTVGLRHDGALLPSPSLAHTSLQCQSPGFSCTSAHRRAFTPKAGHSETRASKLESSVHEVFLYGIFIQEGDHGMNVYGPVSVLYHEPPEECLRSPPSPV